MTYFKLMDEIFDLCIVQVDEGGLWYLSPHWRKIIQEFESSEKELYTKHLEQENINLNVLSEILNLEVVRRNAYIDKKLEIRTLLYEVLFSTVEPAVLEEETEYIKNVMDYMKLNDSLKDKEKELNAKENAIKDKEKISSLVPEGMTFKKGI